MSNSSSSSRGLSISPPAGAKVPERHPKAPAAGTLLGSHNQDCFGCGASHPTGLHLTAYPGADMTITAKFTVTEHHQGAPGLAHGGLLSCAFDEALGKLMWLVREPAVTGKLETLFLTPVQVGKTLFIKAEIVGQDGRKIYCRAEGRIDSETGPVAVEAAAIFITVPLEHFINNAPEGFREALFGINGKTPELEINP
ncbi:MAG: PaaI family thioesterase [Actinomycetales bacterium]